MRKVIEQPCGSPIAKEHFHHTIENSINLNQLRNYISASEYNDLIKLYPGGKCKIWGVNSGGHNTSKFYRLNAGDLVLFFETGRAFYCADVTYKLSETNFQLAQFLWSADYQNNYEHIYFVDNAQEIDLSITEYNRLHGDRIKTFMQNFTVLWKDEDQNNRIINAVKPPGSNLASNSNRNVWIEKTIVHNQPDRLDGDRALGNAIWSPTASQSGGDIYRNMRDVKQGDLIVHLIDNSHFSGVSIVKNDGVLNRPGLENTPWTGEAYLHYLSDYVELDPVIGRDEFFTKENRKTLMLINNESEVFYTVGLELRQGAYLTPCPKRLSQLLNKIYLNKTGENIPHFDLINLESSPINLEIFKNVCDKYIKHCNQTDWLRDEKYKFNFADWTAENIDFDSQTDEEILGLAKQSQEERYYEQSNAVGVNFILAEKRYKDDFITINDVKYFRELINNNYRDDEPELDHDMTYPKVSAWVSCFNPSNYIAYASGELHFGLAHIAGLGKKYPKKGYKAFQFAQSLLHHLKTLLMERDDLIALYKEHLNHNELTELDWAWITQDFNLFVTRVVVGENDKEPRYWLFAPGRNASLWDEMYKENIMAIGWDQLGDLAQYGSLKEVEKKLRVVLNAKGSKKNDARCCYDFANTIQEGDIIICKKGRHSYIGYGVVVSEYIYDQDRDSYTHVRKVDWKKRGAWKETELKIAIKTLTDLTPYPDYIERLKELIGIGVEINYWWMNANPTIWSYSEMEINDSRVYTTHNDRGNKRRIYKHMQAVKPGDPIIGYIASPNRKITAMLEVTGGVRDSEEGEIFSFKKTEDLDFPVSFDELKIIPELQNSEVIINNQGSLFKLTEKEFEVIMNIIAERNPKTQDLVMEPYTIEDATKDLFLSEDDFREYLDLLAIKKNIVLQGPPGVGKTFVSKRLAYALLGFKDDSKVEMIQFHQTYSYEDFIQGYRPSPDAGFSLATGIFYNMCKRAENNPKSKYVLVIDEINRGNLSKIFGELLMLIEADKRGKEYELSLTYSPGEKFSVPKNIYLIGTMNTADRSIAMVDYALRRRFSFLSLTPQFNKKFADNLQSARFGKRLQKKIINRLTELNEEIKSDTNNLGEGYQIGHSYFCPDGDKPYNNHWYNKKIKYEIAPLLKEYWFDEPEKVNEIVEELLIEISPPSIPTQID
jgi:5-methylcytosine-specific restriction protein B